MRKLMEKRSNLKLPTTTREKIETAELNKLIHKSSTKTSKTIEPQTIKEVIKQGRNFKMAK